MKNVGMTQCCFYIVAEDIYNICDKTLNKGSTSEMVSTSSSVMTDWPEPLQSVHDL